MISSEDVISYSAINALLTAAVETLVVAGYPREVAHWACLCRLQRYADQMLEGGLSGPGLLDIAIATVHETT
jgi:ketol-acid reductoisomerase